MASLKTYSMGFALSILLTVAAFLFVWLHIQTGHVYPSHGTLMSLFVVLGLLQLIVQLVFFLHIGCERTWWNLAALLFALFIVGVVVGGSLWIMQNLQHAHMREIFEHGTPTPQNQLE